MHGGNYQEYFKLTLAIARSRVQDAEDIFIEAASIAKEAAPEDALRKFFQGCEHAQPSDNRVTVGTLFYLARQCGADFGQWKQVAVTLADFHAYMPMHNYIFAPSREPWPASSVDARLSSILLFDADGRPLLDHKGNQKRIPASLWLDQNRPVEQMTWAPGLPMVIRDRLISEGGWIERNGVACFNLYRPPTIEPGNAAEAGPLARSCAQGVRRRRRSYCEMAGTPAAAKDGKDRSHSGFGGVQGIGKDTIWAHRSGARSVLELRGSLAAAGARTLQRLPQKRGDRRLSEARDLGDYTDRSCFLRRHEKLILWRHRKSGGLRQASAGPHHPTNCVGFIIDLEPQDGRHDCRPTTVAITRSTGATDERGSHRQILEHATELVRATTAVIAMSLAFVAELDTSAPRGKRCPTKTAAFSGHCRRQQGAGGCGTCRRARSAWRNPDAATLANSITDRSHCGTTSRSGSRTAGTAGRSHTGWKNAATFQVRNDAAKDGLWVINGSRQVVYAKSELSRLSDRSKGGAASWHVGNRPQSAEVSEVSEILLPSPDTTPMSTAVANCRTAAAA